MAIEIKKDSKVVQIMTAQARRERIDSADVDNTAR